MQCACLILGGRWRAANQHYVSTFNKPSPGYYRCVCGPVATHQKQPKRLPANLFSVAAVGIPIGVLIWMLRYRRMIGLENRRCHLQVMHGSLYRWQPDSCKADDFFRCAHRGQQQ
jgi:hypothetical protein